MLNGFQSAQDGENHYATSIYLLLGVIYFVSITGRTFVFNHILRRLGIPFRSYMLTIGAVHTAMSLLALFLVFFQLQNGSFVYAMPRFEKASIKYLEKLQYGSYSWFSTISNMIRFHASLPLEYALFLPWPLGMISTLINKVRAQLSLVFVIRRCLSSMQFAVGETVAIILFSVTMCVYYHFEWFHREEFRLVRKSQLNYEYVDRCVRLCKQDLALPLQKISSTRTQIEAALCKALCSQSISEWKASLKNVASINRFREGFLLLHQLMNELDFNDNILKLDSQLDSAQASPGGAAAAAQTGGRLVYSFEPRSLRDEVIRMVSALTASTGLLFQVYLRMDAELAYVKVA